MDSGQMTEATPIQESLAILKWLREPDWVEEFTLRHAIDWIERRQTAEMCRVVDALVRGQEVDRLHDALQQLVDWVKDGCSDEMRVYCMTEAQAALKTISLVRT